MIRFCLTKLVVFTLALFSVVLNGNGLNSLRTKRQSYPSQTQIGSTLLPTIVPFYDSKHVSLFNKLTSFNTQLQTTNSIADKYQINKNSIIRTHDSRALGANYINETDLPSNNDCLLWCWNTTNCNLAVYEEKTRGSCYLFDCGSLDDFKCRFTPHGFYSSSVLQVNRNSYFLNEWKSQTNQENELTGLKDRQQPASPMDTKSAVNDGGKDLDKSSNVPATKLPVIAATIKTSKCRHYQFECRNNSECIAIYNVCDGIPQCQDASDESVELECHKARPNSNKPIFTDSESVKSKLDAVTLLNKPKTVSMQSNSYGNPVYSSNNNAKLPADSNSNDQSKLMTYPLNYFNYNYPRTSNDKFSEENALNGNRVASQFGNGDFNSYGLAWNQLSAPNDAYNKQLGNYINNDQDPYSAGLKEPVYWPSFNYPHSLDQVQPIQQRPLATQQLDTKYNLPISFADNRNHQPEYKLAQQQLSPAYKSYLENIVPQAGKSMEPTMSISRINATSLKESSSKPLVGDKPSQVLVKVANNSSSSKHDYSYISNSQKKVPVMGPNVVAVSYLHDTTSQDGRETNSAVIALTLGLFVTSILIVIVGCRMKTFKKRISRRGRSLAHDADYLVNGMYL